MEWMIYTHKAMTPALTASGIGYVNSASISYLLNVQKRIEKQNDQTQK